MNQRLKTAQRLIDTQWEKDLEKSFRALDKAETTRQEQRALLLLNHLLKRNK